VKSIPKAINSGVSAERPHIVLVISVLQECIYFVLPCTVSAKKVTIHQEIITIVMICVPNNRTPKCRKQKLTEVKGEIQKQL
jgi:hypothetical protein